MKWLLILFLVVTVALAPYQIVFSADHPTLPYQTIESTRPDLSGEGMTQCPSGNIFPVAFLERGDVKYRIFVGPGRAVFLHIEAGQVQHVYLTTANDDSKIIVRHAITVDEAKAKYPGGPCQWLESRDV